MFSQKAEILFFTVSAVAGSLVASETGAPPWFVMGLPIIAGGGLSAYFRARSGRFGWRDIVFALPVSVLSGWFMGLGLAELAGDPTPHDAQWAFFIMALIGAQIVEAMSDLANDHAKDIIAGASRGAWRFITRKGEGK